MDYTWFRRFGLPQNARSSLGSSSKIEFGHVISLRDAGGPMVEFCPFVAAKTKWLVIYSSSRYFVRIWKLVIDWLGIVDFDHHSWLAYDEVEDLWTFVAFAHGGRRTIASLLMLATLELWKERNARTFNNVSTMPTIILDKIKLEARTWVLAGAKHFGILISGG
jgi:hypothetical protein